MFPFLHVSAFVSNNRNGRSEVILIAFRLLNHDRADWSCRKNNVCFNHTIPHDNNTLAHASKIFVVRAGLGWKSFHTTIKVSKCLVVIDGDRHAIERAYVDVLVKAG
jgi:hypothetical protein